MIKTLPNPKKFADNEMTQWIFILGTLSVMTITCLAMYHQIKLNKKQLARIKEQDAVDHNRNI